jgi:dTDP-D-glucose 4,6-dehydratase
MMNIVDISLTTQCKKLQLNDVSITFIGTMSPFEHGEVFVLDDGGETDLDLGHYERIAGITVNKNNICTHGILQKELIEEQEHGKYLGETIQVNGPKEQLDFTYIDDAADGIASASVSDNTDNMTYNITRGTSRTLLEAAELAVKIAGTGTIQVNERDDNFPSRGQLNTIRAQNDFGFTPTVNIEQGFQQYYDWLTNSFYRTKKAV